MILASHQLSIYYRHICVILYNCFYLQTKIGILQMQYLLFVYNEYRQRNNHMLSEFSSYNNFGNAKFWYQEIAFKTCEKNGALFQIIALRQHDIIKRYVINDYVMMMMISMTSIFV